MRARQRVLQMTAFGSPRAITFPRFGIPGMKRSAVRTATLLPVDTTVPSEGRNGTGSLGRTWSVKGRVTRRLSGLGMFGSEPA